MVEYSEKTMRPYWDDRRQRLERLYSDQDYNTNHEFSKFERKVYKASDADPLMSKKWTLLQIEMYLRTWSPYKKFLLERKEGQEDPLEAFISKVKKMIGSDAEDELDVAWNFVVILAKK